MIVGNADEMREVGRRLSASLLEIPAGPIVITLQGELGAGKTTLVRGVLQAFGVVGAVRSPTYTLIEPYELMGRRIYHLDLYRLGNARDLDGLGLRDLLEPDAILLIEWPERAGEGALPRPDLEVKIAYAADARVEGEKQAEVRRLRLLPLTCSGVLLANSVQSSGPTDK